MLDQTLHPFQADTVSWLHKPRSANGYNADFNCGVIGHEMGLGKTACALSAIKSQVQKGKRFLILAPGATSIQWQRQWKRWILENEDDEFGTDSLFRITSSTGLVPKGNSCVMSHALLAKVDIIKKLVAMNFDGIIVDEGHKFGTRGSKRVQHLWALRNLTASKFSDGRIILTGTPVRNYAHEFYNLAHLVSPSNFRTFEDFARRYLTWDQKRLYNAAQFHSDMSAFYIRYETKDVFDQFPEIRWTQLYTEITDPFVKEAYNAQLDALDNLMSHGEEVGQFSLLGYLMKLRHITGIAKAKEPAIIEPIEDYLSAGNKIVLGIHHKLVAERLRNSLPDFHFFALTGGMSEEEKAQVIDDFNSYPKECALLLSMKAADVGVDGLQRSTHDMWIFEQLWNFSDKAQVSKRIHRIGQSLGCRIEETVATGTVDEYFIDLCEMKRRIGLSVENTNFENDRGFMKELAEKVVANRLR